MIYIFSGFGFVFGIFGDIIYTMFGLIKSNLNLFLQIVAVIISLFVLFIAFRTAYLTKNNQKRNERYLMYQFKLESLKDEIVKRSNKSLKNSTHKDYYNGLTDKQLYAAIDISKLSNEYERIYNKMINEFGLEGI